MLTEAEPTVIANLRYWLTEPQDYDYELASLDKEGVRAVVAAYDALTAALAAERGRSAALVATAEVAEIYVATCAGIELGDPTRVYDRLVTTVLAWRAARQEGG